FSHGLFPRLGGRIALPGTPRIRGMRTEWSWEGGRKRGERAIGRDELLHAGRSAHTFHRVAAGDVAALRSRQELEDDRRGRDTGGKTSGAARAAHHVLAQPHELLPPL